MTDATRAGASDESGASRKRSLGDVLRANVVNAARQKLEDAATTKKEARELLDAFLPRLIAAIDKTLAQASLAGRENATLTFCWQSDVEYVYVSDTVADDFTYFGDDEAFTVNLQKALVLEGQYCEQAIYDHYKPEIDVEKETGSKHWISFTFNWATSAAAAAQ